MRRERGFALLVVLWSLVLLGLLLAQVMAAGRSAVALAGNLRAASVARAAAEAAIHEAMFHLLVPDNQHWAIDGQRHTVTVDTISVDILIEPLMGKINPNLASEPLLEGLIRTAGISPDAASQIANSIVTWREAPATPEARAAQLASYRQAGRPYGPPGQPFSDLAELPYVLGMTPDLFAKLAPDLDLYQTGDPQPEFADKAVREALALASQKEPGGNVYRGAPVVVITTRVDGADGVGLSRRAIASIPGQASATPFRILAEDDGY